MSEDLLNQLDDYIYVSDLQTHELLFLNTIMRTALGVSEENYKGKLCHKLLQGHDEPCPYCKNALLDEDCFQQCDEPATMLGRVFARRDKILTWHGRRCRLSIARDITDQREQQHRQHEDLSKALEAAQQATLAQSRFLSSISHELRTPLNAILGFINVAMVSTGRPALQAVAHQKAERSARYLMTLLNDALDVANMESGTFALTPAAFEFADFIGELCALYVLEGRQRNLTFRPSVEFFPADTLYGDAIRLKQMLTCLLSNACKFTDAGGSVALNVRSCCSAHEMLWLEFVVSDTGRGMSQEFMTRMFQAFEVEKAVVGVGEPGVGLGLPICKKIVDLMGGTLDISSTPGEGTQCSVRVPLGVRHSRRDSLSAAQLSRLHQLLVLVVDDAEGCEHSKRILDSLSINADMVNNGLHAVDMLQDMVRQGRQYDACIVHGSVADLAPTGFWQMLIDGQGVDANCCAVSMVSYAEASVCMNEHAIPFFISKPYLTTPVLDFLCTVGGTTLPQPQPEAQSHDFTGKRLLLVEDNELNREVARELLSKVCKFSIEIAENGREAVSMFQQHPAGYYDIILMDICMPVLDGHAAAKEIRGMLDNGGSEVPIVALSANALEEDRNRSKQCGMNEHVTKPLDLNVLCPVLASALQ